MSTAEIERFNQDLHENKEIQEAVKNIGNDVERIVTLANSLGYDFTTEDIDARAKHSEELSEEQLDKVAGGAICILSVNFQTIVLSGD